MKRYSLSWMTQASVTESSPTHGCTGARCPPEPADTTHWLQRVERIGFSAPPVD